MTPTWAFVPHDLFFAQERHTEFSRKGGRGGPLHRPETALEAVRLLLNYVLSDPYVDVALVGMRDLRLVELNNEISDDVVSRIDLAKLRDRQMR